jgi:hypothetical protein
MSFAAAPASRRNAARIASTLTIGIPQIAASTARRWSARRARSDGVEAWAGTPFREPAAAPDAGDLQRVRGVVSVRPGIG